MALPTQPQISERFETATREQVPHYNWIPPEWKVGKPKLEDNTSGKVSFPNPPNLNCILDLRARINVLKEKFPNQLKEVSAERSVEAEPNTDQPVNGTLEKMPHPLSDCSHVDSGVLTKDEIKEFHSGGKIFDRLRDLSRRDGELARAIGEMEVPIQKARSLLEDNPKGMQRLARTFEWILCQATTLLGELNAALQEGNQNGYQEARNAYIELLRDLDDHEPKTNMAKKVEPGVRGYGKTLKWAYLFPIINEGKIKGMKVVVKWNPHISSSGIPVTH